MPEPIPEPEPPPAAFDTATYVNSGYGYSVEYPSDWDVLEGLGGMVVSFLGPLVLEDADNLLVISIRVIELDTLDIGMTLADLVRDRELMDERYIVNYNKLDEYSTTVGGLPANIQTFTGTFTLNGENITLKYRVARFVKDKLGYVISYYVPAEFDDQYADCFDLAINSFKFD
jgi:hypothetical protein